MFIPIARVYDTLLLTAMEVIAFVRVLQNLCDTKPFNQHGKNPHLVSMTCYGTDVPQESLSSSLIPPLTLSIPSPHTSHSLHMLCPAVSREDAHNTTNASGRHQPSLLNTLEYVALTVTLTHKRRGDLRISLLSPNSTYSTLSTTRKNDEYVVSQN